MLARICCLLAFGGISQRVIRALRVVCHNTPSQAEAPTWPVLSMHTRPKRDCRRVSSFSSFQKSCFGWTVLLTTRWSNKKDE